MRSRNLTKILESSRILLLILVIDTPAFGQDVPENSQQSASLVVYKKWIGMSGKAAAVRIELDCENGEYYGFRVINEGEPDGWEIRDVHPDGMLCNVAEELRENYRPDIIDCQGLYILPGRTEECTLVNTRIVKRIETLNRYGKIVLILLVLAVGMMAMKRRI